MARFTTYTSLPSFRRNRTPYRDYSFTAGQVRRQDAHRIELISPGLTCSHSHQRALGSFLEFLPVLDKLRHEYIPDTLPYHLIVPSHPGYGFSSAPPPDKDMRLEDAAGLLNKMMVLLGFRNQGHVVQGGDVGSKVARVIAAEHDSCKGKAPAPPSQVHG